MKTSLSGERIVFLDYLRVVAIFMVLVVHSIEPFYLGGEGTLLSSYGDARWVTFLDSALRCAVPLFVLLFILFKIMLKFLSYFYFIQRFFYFCG